MSKIIFIEPLGVETNKLKEILKDVIANNEVIFYDDIPQTKQEIIARSKDADILVLAQRVIDKEVIDNCPNLKFINIAFTGYDHVDVDYCKEKAIKVSNCSGYSAVGVSELAFGLMLNLFRSINLCHQASKNSKDKSGLIGNELAGKTIGIVGCGKIGKRVVELALAFNMNVLIYSRHNPQIENTRFVDKETLFKESDIVSLHIPANSETKHFVSENELKLMKQTAILINTARGAVVDNNALANALNNGSIAAAGIDVFDYEPPLKPDYCLLNCKNIILTPHVGFATKEAFIKRAYILLDNIKAYQNNQQINKIV